MNKKILMLAAGLPLALATAVAHATLPINFLPTAAGANQVNGIASFDWSPGNVLSQNGITAIGNFNSGTGACTPGSSCDFNVRIQQKLGQFLDSSSNSIPATGLNTTYTLTTVWGFGETVTGLNATGTVANFRFNAADTTNNYFQMYYIPGIVDDVNAAGGQFTSGTLLMHGTVQPTFGNGPSSFTVTQNSPPPSLPPLDSFGPDGQSPATTVRGNGSTDNYDVVVSSLVIDAPSFFPQLQGIDSLKFVNISQTLPFVSVNPSLRYDLPGGGSIPRDINQPNGTAGANPNLVFQTDNNGPVDGSSLVPEPATVALLGIGFSALGISRRRRAR